MSPRGGQKPKFGPKKRPKYPYYTISDLKTIPNIKKIAFNTKRDTISSKQIAKQWGVTIYISTPGGQKPEF
jgi:hypothetical protein